MPRLTVAVTDAEYEAVKRRALVGRRSLAREAGYLIGLGLAGGGASVSMEAPGDPPRSSTGGGSAVEVRPSPPPDPKAEPAQARRRAGRASSGKVRLLSGGTCRHGTPHCRICGTGRYAS